MVALHPRICSNIYTNIFFMKKIIYLGAILASGVTLIVGCKKSVIEPVGSNSKTESIQLKNAYYTTDSKMLIFNTVEDFDAIIENAGDDLYSELRSLDFTCYAETLDDHSPNLVEDEFLSYVLNEHFIVQIGNYIYKINKPNQTVFALSTEHASSYNDLVAENITNEYVLPFSTEDNVFELLAEVESTDKSSTSCRNSNSSVDPWFMYADFIDVNNIYGNGTDKRYKFERRFMVRYDNWGIYRKLFTEFKHNENWFGLWDETYFTVAYQVSYQIKGGGSGTFTHYPSYPFATTSQTVNVPTNQYEYLDDNKEIVHYRATKCLKAYDLKSWCWMRNRATLKHNLVPGSSGYLRVNDNLDVW